MALESAPHKQIAQDGAGSTLRVFSSRGAHGLLIVGEHATGWPFRCTASYGFAREPITDYPTMIPGTWDWTFGQRSESVRVGGLRVPFLSARHRNGQATSYLALPMRPLVGGLLLNTAFYGTVFFGSMRLLAAIKQRRRVRKGLCMHCGYPCPSPVVACPECGRSPARR